MSGLCWSLLLLLQSSSMDLCTFNRILIISKRQALSTSSPCRKAVKLSKKGFLSPEMFMMSGVRLWLMQCSPLTAV